MPVASQWPEWIGDIISAIGVLVALAVLVRGVIEYLRQNALRRAEHFAKLRGQLKDNVMFKDICSQIENDDSSLLQVAFADKRDFLGLFEEVAISMNSGLIRPAVAHYMFGYYAIRCEESENFWSDVNRQSVYWSLFRDFAKRMKDMEQRSSYESRQYRF